MLEGDNEMRKTKGKIMREMMRKMMRMRRVRKEVFWLEHLVLMYPLDSHAVWQYLHQEAIFVTQYDAFHELPRLCGELYPCKDASALCAVDVSLDR